MEKVEMIGKGKKRGEGLHTIKFLEDTLNGAGAAAAAHLDVEFVVVFRHFEGSGGGGGLEVDVFGGEIRTRAQSCEGSKKLIVNCGKGPGLEEGRKDRVKG